MGTILKLPQSIHIEYDGKNCQYHLRLKNRTLHVDFRAKREIPDQTYRVSGGGLMEFVNRPDGLFYRANVFEMSIVDGMVIDPALQNKAHCSRVLPCRADGEKAIVHLHEMLREFDANVLLDESAAKATRGEDVNLWPNLDEMTDAEYAHAAAVAEALRAWADENRAPRSGLD